MSKNFNIGLALKNIGHIQTDLAISSLPSEYGVGVSYNLDFFKSTLLADVIYNDLKKEVKEMKEMMLELNLMNKIAQGIVSIKLFIMILNLVIIFQFLVMTGRKK